jgi:hypothetical protein
MMWESVKSALVLILVLMVVFCGGVLGGVKLPETEVWQRWQGARQARQERLKPADVAVIQLPGDNGCQGGVCKVEPPQTVPAEDPTPPPEKKPPLTFYRELGDHPSPAAPAVQEQVADAGSENVIWEIRVCSLPREVLARLERSKLLKKYPRVEIESVVLNGKGTWYRVKIVGIRERQTAEHYLQELKQGRKYKPLIIKHTQG